MSRRSHRSDRQGTDVDDLTVRDRLTLEGDRVGGVDQVFRSVSASELEASGDVVVVQVGLGDVRDVDAGFAGCVFHPVGIPLRVNDQCHGAVMHEVASVTQFRGFDNDNVHGS